MAEIIREVQYRQQPGPSALGQLRAAAVARLAAIADGTRLGGDGD